MGGWGGGQAADERWRGADVALVEEKEAKEEVEEEKEAAGNNRG